MTVTLKPGRRSGTVTIPASKSQAHRLLICAALGGGEVRLLCDGISKDIAATMDCLNGLGAEVRETSPGVLDVVPIRGTPEGERHLHCGESGSTLRFLLPVAGVLGAKAVFHMEGRLPQRPLAPLDALLERGGMALRREGDLLYCAGRLNSGKYTLPGDVSSQYVSGLLLSLPLAGGGESVLSVTGPMESAPYVAMTEEALRLAGCVWERERNTWVIPGGQTYRFPRTCRVEGDWSNAAFFLCMGALSGEGVTVTGLSPTSQQGDRAVLDILRQFGAEVAGEADWVTVRRKSLRGITIDAAQIPDLIPVLSVVAAGAEGETKVVNAARLRLKESDRLKSTAALLAALGGEAEELPDGLVIRGRGSLAGGRVDPWGDHRIAMAAAAASCLCRGDVVVENSACAAKSYPRFWEDFAALKGGEA